MTMILDNRSHLVQALV